MKSCICRLAGFLNFPHITGCCIRWKHWLLLEIQILRWELEENFIKHLVVKDYNCKFAAKIMQISAMKVRFQFSECSLSYANK